MAQVSLRIGRVCQSFMEEHWRKYCELYFPERRPKYHCTRCGWAAGRASDPQKNLTDEVMAWLSV